MRLANPLSNFSRRALVGAACATVVVGPALAQDLGVVERQALKDWAEFKRRFVTADGRVIDTGNGGCSHTEGQGLGLLFAVAHDDPETFDSLLNWTARHLRRPSDALHGWRYEPNKPCPVADWNNATDGDLFIAGALLRASRRWGRSDHASAAAAIARDVLRLLTREAGHRLVLLPGAAGFDTPESVTVNPSYYIFPILAELSEIAPSPLWERLRADGIALIEEGRFGAAQLPPDWLCVSRADGSLRPHPHWPARFSFDAIRVPLYLAWGRVAPGAADRAFAAWTASHTVQPAWVDLTTNATAPYAAPPGMLAIGMLASDRRFSGARQKIDIEGRLPPVHASGDYYSAALTLLCGLAWRESGDGLMS